MDTKTSPKLPRELFAQIKSNLLCQAFMLQMVFESSSSQPIVVGRGGLLNLKYLAGQEKFPSCSVSEVSPWRWRDHREQNPGQPQEGAEASPCSQIHI